MSMGGGGDLKGIEGPGGGIEDSLDSVTSYLKVPKCDSSLPSGLSLSLVLFDVRALSWGWDCASNSEGKVATDCGPFTSGVEVFKKEVKGVGV
jgi:hypothetical protein